MVGKKWKKFGIGLVLCVLITIGSLFVASVQASATTLSEDFEDNILDSRISIETTGTYNSNPEIKNITNFGSTKAFGYGISTCLANCFDSHVTNFKITFAQPTYVSNISFKEMELYDNWGSKGKIYIDGVPISWGTYNENEDFGREPMNDHQADTTYRLQSYSIKQYVTVIEIKVHDITNLSEIFIDDLAIDYDENYEGTCIWEDNFENYTPSQRPLNGWSYTGNLDVFVDNSMSVCVFHGIRMRIPRENGWPFHVKADKKAKKKTKRRRSLNIP